MILVEGPDGSGKTTVVEFLCREFGFRQGERGTKDRDRLYEVTRKDTHRALALAIEAIGPPLVWDRLFYSDFVYAPIQGREVAFKEPEASIIQGILDSLAPPLILCMPPAKVCEENAAKDHQMPGVEGNVRKIHKRYKEMFLDGEFSGMGTTGALWYDYTGEAGQPRPGVPYTYDLEVLKDYVQEYVEAREQEWKV